MKRTCSVAGCGRPRQTYAWCFGHYERLRKHGDVQADRRLNIRRRDRKRLNSKGKNICARCRKTLPVRMFPKSGSPNTCKLCTALYMRCRKYSGVTPELLISVFKKQKGRCRICRRVLLLCRTERERDGRQGPRDDTAVVDHCHETGIFRGLLCLSCNFGIGSFRNSSKRLRAAARYLKDFEPHISRKGRRINKRRIRSDSSERKESRNGGVPAETSAERRE